MTSIPHRYRRRAQEEKGGMEDGEQAKAEEVKIGELGGKADENKDKAVLKCRRH